MKRKMLANKEETSDWLQDTNCENAVMKTGYRISYMTFNGVLFELVLLA